ncbi:hypothetical protein DIPPA_14451 [Diplonema papillatum]|nr:hypothetical protein DIPPA_14451 [Diplonema papillatum]
MILEDADEDDSDSAVSASSSAFGGAYATEVRSRAEAARAAAVATALASSSVAMTCDAVLAPRDSHSPASGSPGKARDRPADDAMARKKSSFFVYDINSTAVLLPSTTGDLLDVTKKDIDNGELLAGEGQGMKKFKGRAVLTMLSHAKTAEGRLETKIEQLQHAVRAKDGEIARVTSEAAEQVEKLAEHVRHLERTVLTGKTQGKPTPSDSRHPRDPSNDAAERALKEVRKALGDLTRRYDSQTFEVNKLQQKLFVGDKSLVEKTERIEELELLLSSRDAAAPVQDNASASRQAEDELVARLKAEAEAHKAAAAACEEGAARLRADVAVFREQQLAGDKAREGLEAEVQSLQTKLWTLQNDAGNLHARNQQLQNELKAKLQQQQTVARKAATPVVTKSDLEDGLRAERDALAAQLEELQEKYDRLLDERGPGESDQDTDQPVSPLSGPSSAPGSPVGPDDDPNPPDSPPAAHQPPAPPPEPQPSAFVSVASKWVKATELLASRAAAGSALPLRPELPLRISWDEGRCGTELKRLYDQVKKLCEMNIALRENIEGSKKEEKVVRSPVLAKAPAVRQTQSPVTTRSEPKVEAQGDARRELRELDFGDAPWKKKHKEIELPHRVIDPCEQILERMMQWQRRLHDQWLEKRQEIRSKNRADLERLLSQMQNWPDTTSIESFSLFLSASKQPLALRSPTDMQSSTASTDAASFLSKDTEPPAHPTPALPPRLAPGAEENRRSLSRQGHSPRGVRVR